MSLELNDFKRHAYIIGASVDHDEPLFYSKGGKVGVGKIGEIVDSYYNGEEEGFADSPDLEVLSFDGQLSVGWHRALSVFRHRYSGRMLRFTADPMHSVSVTPDHSLFVLKNGRIVNVPSAQIAIGDYMAVLLGKRVALLKVREIGEEDPSSGFVYDVSVPGLENFVAGGVFCHNTGKGKSTLLANFVMNIADPKVQSENPSSAIVIDPHGDLAYDIAGSLRDWSNFRLFDPTRTNFSLNPLEPFTQPVDEAERASMLQSQVSQLSMILSDVTKTSADFAPRLMWIFRGSLYYLYSFSVPPTFLDLYALMSELMSPDRRERIERDDLAELMKRANAPDELIAKTMEAISKLDRTAFTPVMNRIANFVMPPNSYTSRTFCTRHTTLPFWEMVKPGSVTVFRLPEHGLPADFKEIFASTLLLRLYFLIIERARKIEEAGGKPEDRTPVFLLVDEFQLLQKLEILETIISEARKFGLYLILSHQNTAQITSPALRESIFGNVGLIISFGVGKDDAERLSRIFGENHFEDLINAKTGEVWVWKSPQAGGRAEIFNSRTYGKPEQAHARDELERFMSQTMERLYGGAKEDRVPVFASDVERLKRERGTPAMEPIEWSIISCLHYGGESFYREIKERVQAQWGWSDSEIQNALINLERDGWITGRPALMDRIQKGVDAEGNPVYGTPQTEDEKRRALSMKYRVLGRGEQLFAERNISSPRAGGPLHRYIMKLFMDVYRMKGCWVEADYGESSAVRPDIIVYYPKRRQTNSNGIRTTFWDPNEWDFETSIAIEVETNPSKHQEQLIKNYEKNALYHTKVNEPPRLVFVVPEQGMVEDVKRIINPDPERPNYAVVVADLGLPEDRIDAMLKEEEGMNAVQEIMEASKVSSIAQEKTMITSTMDSGDNLNKSMIQTEETNGHPNAIENEGSQKIKKRESENMTQKTDLNATQSADQLQSSISIESLNNKKFLGNAERKSVAELAREAIEKAGRPLSLAEIVQEIQRIKPFKAKFPEKTVMSAISRHKEQFKKVMVNGRILYAVNR